MSFPGSLDFIQPDMVDPDPAFGLAQNEGDVRSAALNDLRGSPEPERHKRPRDRSGKGGDTPVGETLPLINGTPVIHLHIETAALGGKGFDFVHLHEEGKLVYRIRFEIGSS